MDYFEQRKTDEILQPIVEFDRKYYNLTFDHDMLSHRVYYDVHNRYFVFSVDLFEFMKSNWSSSKCYINQVQSCNKRKEIGELLVRRPFHVLIVYYTTSKRFKIYINIYYRIIKFKECNLRYLSLHGLEGFIEKINIFGEKSWNFV